MIYLASPYSHQDPAVREFRYHRVQTFAARCLSKGLPVFSPIAYGHPMTINHAAPTDAHSWLHFNSRMISASTHVWVLCLDGWVESIGVQLEIAQAHREQKPISYMVDYETF